MGWAKRQKDVHIEWWVCKSNGQRRKDFPWDRVKGPFSGWREARDELRALRRQYPYAKHAVVKVTQEQILSI